MTSTNKFQRKIVEVWIERSAMTNFRQKKDSFPSLFRTTVSKNYCFGASGAAAAASEATAAASVAT